MANFCTGNTISTGSKYAVSNGALTASTSTQSWQGGFPGTFSVSSGKWYWEVTLTSNGGFSHIGAIRSDWMYYCLSSPTDLYNYTLTYQTDGRLFFADTSSSVDGITASSTGHVIAFALDMDNKKMWLRFNDGSWYNSGDPVAGTNQAWGPSHLNADAYTPLIHMYGNLGGVTNAISTYNFGQFPFRHTPPSGFVALSTENLAEPPISNLAAEKPEDYNCKWIRRN